MFTLLLTVLCFGFYPIYHGPYILFPYRRAVCPRNRWQSSSDEVFTALIGDFMKDTIHHVRTACSNTLMQAFIIPARLGLAICFANQ